jgi:ribosomal protein S8
VLYNYNFSYILNLININKLKKNLYFFVIFTKKNYYFVKILKKFNVIHDFKLIKKNNFNFIKISLFFYKNKNICSNLKIISRPAKTFLISYEALKLLNKKSGSSVFLISTDKGILSHHEAIKLKIGGSLIVFFSL